MRTNRLRTYLLVLIMMLSCSFGVVSVNAAVKSEKDAIVNMTISEKEQAQLDEKGYFIPEEHIEGVTMDEDDFRALQTSQNHSTYGTTTSGVYKTGLFRDNYATGTWQRDIYNGVVNAIKDGALKANPGSYAEVTFRVSLRGVSGSTYLDRLYNNYYGILQAVVRDHLGSFNWATNRYGFYFQYTESYAYFTAQYYSSSYYKSSYESTVKSKISKAVSYAGSGSRYQKVKKVYNWLCNNCSYDYDNLYASEYTSGHYFAHSQVGLFIKSTGVCETYAKGAKMIFQKMGIPCVVVGSSTHAYNYVKMDDGKWYLFDATWGDQVSYIDYDYFLVSNNSYIDYDHTDDNYQKYPLTSTKKYNPNVPNTTITSGTNTTSGIKLTWKKVSGCTYVVYRKTASSSYTKLAAVKGTSYTDTTAKSGTRYYYKVKVKRGTSYSKGVDKSVYRLAPVLAKNITLKNISSGVEVKWNKITGAAGYYVYRKRSSDSSYKKIATIADASTTGYLDRDVANANGVKYTYTIRAYKSTVKGSGTGKEIFRLTSIKISSLSNVSGAKLKVKWTANTKASGYQVKISTSKTFASGNTVYTVTDPSIITKTSGTLTKGKTYYVMVRAYRKLSNGTTHYSAWTSVKSVKISR